MKAVTGIQKVTGKATETYTAYGATEMLYRECAQQADYSITQVPDSEVETPKTGDGEDLGIGEGWWLSGKSAHTNWRITEANGLYRGRTEAYI
jgi:cytochrome b pre-mRNA-processing protein 3